MPRRPDFKEVDDTLSSIEYYAEQFDRYDRDDWVHLKHKEDFRSIYSDYPLEVTAIYDELYSSGRGHAHTSCSYLSASNNIDSFPTLSAFIEGVEQSYTFDHDLVALVTQAKKTMECHGAPWATEMMVKQIETQLGLIEAVKIKFRLLKQSRLYREEKNLPMNEKEEKSSVTIGNFQGVLGNISGSTVTQNLQMDVQKNDFESLAQFLKSIKVSPSDIESLQEAILSDPPPPNAKQLGARSAGWIGKMVSKSLNGAWEFSRDTAAAVLAGAILRYYGLAD